MKDNNEECDPKIIDEWLVNLGMTPATEYTCITCQCHKTHIAELEAQLAHKDAVIEVLGKRFEDMCGTCPADLENWGHPNGCGNECDTRKDRNLICWKQWAEAKAKEGK